MKKISQLENQAVASKQDIPGTTLGLTKYAEELLDNGKRLEASGKPVEASEEYVAASKHFYNAGLRCKSCECSKRAADLGHAGAQYSTWLGYKGECGQNDEKAFHYLKLSADQGYFDAQYEIGLEYVRGNRVVHSYRNAFKQFKLAADQGHRDAPEALGRLYVNGWGVDQNYYEALEYYKQTICVKTRSLSWRKNEVICGLLGKIIALRENTKGAESKLIQKLNFLVNSK